MIEWLTNSLVALGLLAGVFNLVLGAAKRLPSLVSLGAVAIVELGLLVQAVATIVLLATGSKSSGDIFEFFGYILVALLVPAGAAVWALAERNRQSTLILGIAPLVVVVMILRMSIIWFGQ
ncbi:MAG: hypothetical protein RL719_1074 [Actinomycetota bacterium]|jgi:hypothetical protein